jgi:hypothetical protein
MRSSSSRAAQILAVIRVASGNFLEMLVAREDVRRL